MTRIRATNSGKDWGLLPSLSLCATKFESCIFEWRTSPPLSLHLSTHRAFDFLEAPANEKYCTRYTDCTCENKESVCPQVSKRCGDSSTCVCVIHTIQKLSFIMRPVAFASKKYTFFPECCI